MFHLLKQQKQARELVPNLVNDKGDTLTSKEDNLDYVFNFYSDIFASTPIHSVQKTNARAQVSQT